VPPACPTSSLSHSLIAVTATHNGIPRSNSHRPKQNWHVHVLRQRLIAPPVLWPRGSISPAAATPLRMRTVVEGLPTSLLRVGAILARASLPTTAAGSWHHLPCHYCAAGSSDISDVHSVRLSRSSCMMSALSLYESSPSESRSEIASSNACRHAGRGRLSGRKQSAAGSLNSKQQEGGVEVATCRTRRSQSVSAMERFHTYTSSR